MPLMSDTNRRGSESSLPNLWGMSMDSATTEEDDLERRGSEASAPRRGSRLLEFLEKKNKKDKKKYKDKQGFVWRRMIHDNEDFLPAPRAPSLGQGACPWLLSKDYSIASMPAASPPLAPILSNKSEPAPIIPQSDANKVIANDGLQSSVPGQQPM